MVPTTVPYLARTALPSWRTWSKTQHAVVIWSGWRNAGKCVCQAVGIVPASRHMTGQSDSFASRCNIGTAAAKRARF